MHHPEVAADIFRGILALLLSDDHDLMFAEGRETADYRRIVAEVPVAVKLHEVGGEAGYVIEGIRPFRVPRDLNAPPSTESIVYIAAHRFEFLR